MQSKNIQSTILDLFGQKELLKNIDENRDFFDLGVSSLTIVDLQIRVEEALGLEVPTSQLMRLPTIRGWIDLYNKKELETGA